MTRTHLVKGRANEHVCIFIKLLIDDNDTSKASEGNVTVLYPEINV